jgi:hypothetical protein
VSKPSVNQVGRRQNGARLLAASLSREQAGETRRRSELPRLGLLGASDVDRAAEHRLGLWLVGRGPLEQEFTVDPEHFRLPHVLAKLAR